MTTRRPRHPLVRTLAFGALGAGLVAAACEAPHPTGVKPNNKVPLTAIRSAAPEMAKDGSPSLDEVRVAMKQHMPQVLSGATRARMVWFVSNAAGTVVHAAFESGDAPGAPVTVRSSNLSVQAGPAEIRVKDATTVMPGAPAFLDRLDPKSIASVNVLKLAAGRLTPDSVGVIWIALRAPGEAAKLDERDLSVRTQGDPTANAAARGGEARFRATIVAPRDERAPAAATAESQGGGKVRIVAGNEKSAAGQPIYYVDGVVAPAGADGKPALPAPERIESINVLKGSAAVERYGESAGAGVILITTKKQ